MVSRRRILSKSRDDIGDILGHPVTTEDEEDCWHRKEQLYRDHIQEVLNKWESIDDEIWAKIIVMERNRRVAKAYARAPVLTVNGADEGFDGFRIGLNGFENPYRDPETSDCRRNIGAGVKFKMDEDGNIFVKRISKCSIFVKNMAEENSICNDVLKLPSGALSFEKGEKLFDVRKFQQNIDRELKRAYPDRRKLENQCIIALSLGRPGTELLECPLWVMIINVVALDMLKAKLPPPKRLPSVAPAVPNRPTASDEDPYSLSSGSGSSGSSGVQPKDIGPKKITPEKRHMQNNSRSKHPRTTRGTDRSRKEDPYYSGMAAKSHGHMTTTTSNASKRPVIAREPRGREAIIANRLPPPTTSPPPSTHPLMTKPPPLPHVRSFDGILSSQPLFPHNGELKVNGVFRKKVLPSGNNQVSLHHSRTVPEFSLQEDDEEWEHYWTDTA